MRGLAQGRAGGRALQCVYVRAHACMPWLSKEPVWRRTGHQLVSYATSDICFFICDVGPVISSQIIILMRLKQANVQCAWRQHMPNTHMFCLLESEAFAFYIDLRQGAGAGWPG